MRWALPGVAAGAGALSVLSSVVPGSPGGGWSWCRLAAVSVCCPVLPEAVVGASRATRGRLVSTQGCHRCPCPSRWARPTVRRAWWLSLLLPARQHTEGAPAPATEATVLRNPLQKKRNRRSLRKHVAFVAAAVAGCCRCSRRPACCCVAAACRCCRCCVAAGVAVALLRTQPLLPVAKLRISR